MPVCKASGDWMLWKKPEINCGFISELIAQRRCSQDGAPVRVLSQGSDRGASTLRTTLPTLPDAVVW